MNQKILFVSLVFALTPLFAGAWWWRPVTPVVVTSPVVRCASSHLDQVSTSNADRQLSLMQEAGITMTRFDFTMETIEPTQGTFNFTKYDYIVDTAKTKGIGVIALIPQYSVPDWANNSQGWGYPPSPATYADFVKAIVGHYKGKITYYELGNEPDLPWAWSPWPDAAGYTNLLKAGYTAAKSVDPNCKIISAGITPWNAPDVYMNTMYANGAKGYFDIFGFHNYSWPEAPNFTYFPAIKSIMKSNGDDKPIMITEVGWPSTTQSGGVTQTQQATYIKQTFQLAANNNISLICIYDFVDDGTDRYNSEQNFGVLTAGYVKKPSFNSFK